MGTNGGTINDFTNFTKGQKEMIVDINMHALPEDLFKNKAMV